MATTINDLPDELLSDVVRHLDNSRRAAARDRLAGGGGAAAPNPVCAFCLVSRRFRNVGEPFLYSFFASYGSDDARERRARRHFLSTIIQHPSLAARVSELWLGILVDDYGDRWLRRRAERARDDVQSGSGSESDSDGELGRGDCYAGCSDYDDLLRNREHTLAFVSAAHHVSMPNKKQWLEDLRAGLTDAEIALLLAHTPNLSSLLVQLPDKENYDLFYAHFRGLLAHAVQHPSPAKAAGPLAALRSIHIDHRWDSFFALGFPARCLRDFFLLPSLRELDGYRISTEARYQDGWDSDTDTDSDLDFDLDNANAQDTQPLNAGSSPASSTEAAAASAWWPQRASPITHLTFREANLTSATLAHIVTACKSLCSLSCTWDIQIEDPSADRASNFSLPDIHAALALHAVTLTHLTLDVPYPFYYDEHYLLPPIGSLKVFAALRHLEISALLLMGSIGVGTVVEGARGDHRFRRRRHRFKGPLAGSGYVEPLADVLPDSLETLEIRNRWVEGPVLRYLVPLVLEIARGCAQRLPRLRSLALDEWARALSQDVVASLCGALRFADVALVLDERVLDPKAQLSICEAHEAGCWRGEAMA